MKFIGFLLSIESNFFIYYGENMKNYIIIFFRNELIYLSDFNLIKLLFSLEETKKYFSIKKIFELCKIKNFHSLFISNILSNLENSNFDFLNNSDDYKKELNLIKKIFEFIIKAIKDTSSLYLLYEYPLRYKKKVKIVDEFEEYFLNNEENSIYNIIKRNIINYSMTKQNLFKYSNFKSENNLYLFDEKKIEKIFEEMTSKIVQNDGQIQFSLKNEFVNEFDFDYVLNPFLESKAQKYIIEFKKQNISLLNNYFYDTFQILKKLNLYCFYNFFYFNENMQLLIDLGIKLLNDEKYSKISDMFLFSVFKLIIVFMYVDKNMIKKELKDIDKKIFYDNIKEKLNDLLNGLKKNEKENNDEEKKLIYKYLESNIINYLDIKIEKEEKKINQINLEKEKTKDNKKLKEKYKQKFNQKKFLFLKELTEETLDKLEESENCILCRLPLNQNNTNNDNNDIFGLIGTYIKDGFVGHCKYLSLKNSYDKYNKNLSITSESFYRECKSNIRFFSCNHKLHFNCFDQIILDVYYCLCKPEFDCPLCKKLGNIFIPCLNLYNCNNNILKGFKFNDFFNDDFSKSDINENIFVKSNDINWKNALNSSISFLEKVFFKDVFDCRYYEEIFNNIKDEFSNFLIYCTIVDDFKTQIEIWTNLILSLRVLLKNKIIYIDIFICKLFDIIEFFNKVDNEKNFIKIFFNDLITKKIDALLLILLILFDFNFENNQIFIDFINLFSPFLSIISFIKNIFIKNEPILSSTELNNSLKLSNFNDYINNNRYKEEYKILLDNLLKKLYIFKLINNRKLNKEYPNNINEGININLYKEFSINEIEDKPFSELIYNLKGKEKGDESNKTNNNIIKIISNKIDNKLKIEKIFQKFSEILEIVSLRYIISQDLLLFGNKLYFKFIPLKKNLLEHLDYIQKEKCIYCNKDKNSSLICLLCGEKMCDDILCLPENEKMPYKKSNKHFHSMVYHKGYNAFISDLGLILFYQKGEKIYSYNGIYLNQFGEEFKKNEAVSNNYTLMEKNYEKMEKIFINYSYRKK